MREHAPRPEPEHHARADLGEPPGGLVELYVDVGAAKTEREGEGEAADTTSAVEVRQR